MDHQQKLLLPKGPYVYTKLTEHTGVIRAANNVTILKLSSNMTQQFKDRSRFLAPNMDAMAVLIIESLNAFWATGLTPKDFMQTCFRMLQEEEDKREKENEVHEELP